MKIYIASDHAGFKLKEKIKSSLKNIVDLGPQYYKSEDDYPDYAKKLSKRILKEKAKGILICGTGQGMCIAANKVKGIRAALSWNKQTSKHAKEHLNANILCLPGNTNQILAKKLIKIWIESKFIKEKKYIRRIKKLK